MNEEKCYIIIPDTLGGSPRAKVSENNILSWIYLHGQAESDNGYDICYGKDFSTKDLTEGEYHCKIFGHEDHKATMFIWRNRMFANQFKGLIVYDDDVDAYEDAKVKYESKAISI